MPRHLLLENQRGLKHHCKSHPDRNQNWNASEYVLSSSEIVLHTWEIHLDASSTKTETPSTLPWLSNLVPPPRNLTCPRNSFWWRRRQRGPVQETSVKFRGGIKFDNHGNVEKVKSTRNIELFPPLFQILDLKWLGNGSSVPQLRILESGCKVDYLCGNQYVSCKL